MSKPKLTVKERYSLESRKTEFDKMMFNFILFFFFEFFSISSRMPDRTPVVVEKDPNCNLPGFI